MTLQEFFHNNPRAALAFSGGADSAYLLWAAREWAPGRPGLFRRRGFGLSPLGGQGVGRGCEGLLRPLPLPARL